MLHYGVRRSQRTMVAVEMRGFKMPYAGYGVLDRQNLEFRYSRLTNIPKSPLMFRSRLILGGQPLK